jgi:tRNA A-37 threonylcarbamoyl transferase component Bud32
MGKLTGKTVGHYCLMEQIGQGGMAVVYKARDTAQDRIVAVKILTPSSAADAQVVLRFQREARLLLKLRHPHIVPVEDFRVEDGNVYLVMPYYPAGSLAERLARGPLSPPEGGRIIGQVCAALDFAHRQGVVHRDVKPSNILLDEQGNALLTDFGLAHVTDASVSLTGSAVLGTPSYLSPEQVQATEVDARSDQYSLGVVLYQMTTGRLPFEAETPMAVLIKHVSDPMPLPRSISPSIPEAVERVILKATAKDPDDRFASITEMNEAFQAALAHALDPKHHRAPVIRLGASSTLHLRPAAARSGGRRKRALMAATSLAVVGLLAFCASPIAAPAIVDFLLGSSGPAEGSSGSGEGLTVAQRTAMARTQDAFATQLIGTWSGTLLPEQALTAVAQTMAAEWGQPSSTPGPSEIAAPTAQASEVGGTRTASRTPTPTRTQLSGSLSDTETSTPSRTPTPTPTGTLDPTFTPTQPSTATRTPTPTRTPTATPTATRTSTTVIPSISPTPSATVGLPSPSGTVTPPAAVNEDGDGAGGL